MFAGWLQDGCVQWFKARKALQSNAQECEYHLGWSKSQALDVIPLHCTIGKTETQGG